MANVRGRYSYYNNHDLHDRIERDFTYHPPKGDQQDRYDIIRAKAREFAHFLVSYTPESREQSLALTRLEESVMFANASIARNE
jgi:hypothetical protein